MAPKKGETKGATEPKKKRKTLKEWAAESAAEAEQAMHSTFVHAQESERHAGESMHSAASAETHAKDAEFYMKMTDEAHQDVKDEVSSVRTMAKEVERAEASSQRYAEEAKEYSEHAHKHEEEARIYAGKAAEEHLHARTWAGEGHRHAKLASKRAERSKLEADRAESSLEEIKKVAEKTEDMLENLQNTIEKYESEASGAPSSAIGVRLGTGIPTGGMDNRPLYEPFTVDRFRRVSGSQNGTVTFKLISKPRHLNSRNLFRVKFHPAYDIERGSSHPLKYVLDRNAKSVTLGIFSVEDRIVLGNALEEYNPIDWFNVSKNRNLRGRQDTVWINTKLDTAEHSGWYSLEQQFLVGERPQWILIDAVVLYVNSIKNKYMILEQQEPPSMITVPAVLSDIVKGELSSDYVYEWEKITMEIPDPDPILARSTFTNLLKLNERDIYSTTSFNYKVTIRQEEVQFNEVFVQLDVISKPINIIVSTLLRTTPRNIVYKESDRDKKLTSDEEDKKVILWHRYKVNVNPAWGPDWREVIHTQNGVGILADLLSDIDFSNPVSLRNRNKTSYQITSESTLDKDYLIVAYLSYPLKNVREVRSVSLFLLKRKIVMPVTVPYPNYKLELSVPTENLSATRKYWWSIAESQFDYIPSELAVTWWKPRDAFTPFLKFAENVNTITVYARDNSFFFHIANRRDKILLTLQFVVTVRNSFQPPFALSESEKKQLDVMENFDLYNNVMPVYDLYGRPPVISKQQFDAEQQKKKDKQRFSRAFFTNNEPAPMLERTFAFAMDDMLNLQYQMFDQSYPFQNYFDIITGKRATELSDMFGFNAYEDPFKPPYVRLTYMRGDDNIESMYVLFDTRKGEWTVFNIFPSEKLIAEYMSALLNADNSNAKSDFSEELYSKYRDTRLQEVIKKRNETNPKELYFGVPFSDYRQFVDDRYGKNTFKNKFEDGVLLAHAKKASMAYQTLNARNSVAFDKTQINLDDERYRIVNPGNFTSGLENQIKDLEEQERQRAEKLAKDIEEARLAKEERDRIARENLERKEREAREAALVLDREREIKTREQFKKTVSKIIAKVDPIFTNLQSKLIDLEESEKELATLEAIARDQIKNSLNQTALNNFWKPYQQKFTAYRNSLIDVEDRWKLISDDILYLEKVHDRMDDEEKNSYESIKTDYQSVQNRIKAQKTQLQFHEKQLEKHSKRVLFKTTEFNIKDDSFADETFSNFNELERVVENDMDLDFTYYDVYSNRFEQEINNLDNSSKEEIGIKLFSFKSNQAVNRKFLFERLEEMYELKEKQQLFISVFERDSLLKKIEENPAIFIQNSEFVYTAWMNLVLNLLNRVNDDVERDTTIPDITKAIKLLNSLTQNGLKLTNEAKISLLDLGTSIGGVIVWAGRFGFKELQQLLKLSKGKNLLWRQNNNIPEHEVAIKLIEGLAGFTSRRFFSVDKFQAPGETVTRVNINSPVYNSLTID